MTRFSLNDTLSVALLVSSIYKFIIIFILLAVIFLLSLLLWFESGSFYVVLDGLEFSTYTDQTGLKFVIILLPLYTKLDL